ncbi:MAG TPA: PH domain-containing protein [Proteiniclasticum sp.]|nr:PH domain-containing protein [Proteiniclasticum sp.]
MDRMLEIIEQIDSVGGVSVVLDERDAYLAGVLQDMILTDENVGGIIRGIYSGARGLLICTNQRILFLGRGFATMNDFKSLSYDYGDIGSIEYQKGLLFGKLIINAHGIKNEIHQILNLQAKGFIDYVRNVSPDKL